MTNEIIINKLTSDISRNAYRAIIQEELKNSGFDSSMMDYQSCIDFGKAFEAIEILDLVTDSTKGDEVYKEAERDAKGTIKALQDRYGNSKKYYILMLNEAGFDGPVYYSNTARFDSFLPA